MIRLNLKNLKKYAENSSVPFCQPPPRSRSMEEKARDSVGMIVRRCLSEQVSSLNKRKPVDLSDTTTFSRCLREGMALRVSAPNYLRKE